MEDRITIIEGPTPVFEPVQDGWALGLNETRQFSVTALTRLRTLNGPALTGVAPLTWLCALSAAMPSSSALISAWASATTSVPMAAI